MNLRIQTYGRFGLILSRGLTVATDLGSALDSTNVFEVLEKGLSDLMDLCDVVTEKFTIARDGFETSKMK